ncbi:MAG: BMP family ABC transporter substrate-binding protein [Selenomonadaceae bacterium]|nr:BMP family ABC transporter substrate-binding protein [Selenomonadaceae bacterium]
MKKIMAGLTLLLLAFCAAAFSCSYYWLNNSGRITEMFDRRETVVGVIFEGDRHDSSWNESMLEAFEKIQDYNCRFVYVDFVHRGDGSFGAAVDKLVNRDKAEVIFSLGMQQPADMAQVCSEYPKVKFYTGYGEDSYPNVCGIVVRLYQAQYQAGMLAAAESKSGEIAIVAPMPNPVVIATVNAFALGARRIRPDAKIHVIWTNTFDNNAKVAAACDKILSAYPVDVTAQINQYREVLDICRRRGVKAIGVCRNLSEEYGEVLLGTVVWKSDDFIRTLIKDALEGRFSPASRFVSIDDDMQLVISGAVDSDNRSRIEDVGRRLRYTNRDVFYGPVRDNRGQIRIPAGHNLSDQAVVSRMDWYVDGVVEDVPAAGRK